MKNEAGITLIEIMIVIAILAIFAAIGIPAYTELVSSNTALADAHLIKEDLVIARSAASTYGGNAILCPSNDPTGTDPACGTDWNKGWVVLPASSACTADGNAATQIQTAVPNDVSFTASNGSASQTICFNRYGMPDVSGLLTIQNPSDASQAVCVSVNATGHTSILAKGQGGCV